jgi:hypothetical protein
VYGWSGGPQHAGDFHAARSAPRSTSEMSASSRRKLTENSRGYFPFNFTGKVFMSYFENLRKGSPIHKADIRSDRAFTIVPADEGDECQRKFQHLVAEALRNADRDWHGAPHPQKMWDIPGWIGPLYDFAAISKVT